MIVDAAEDAMTIEGRRRLLSKTGDTSGTGQEDHFIRRAREGMDTQEEATFSVEAPIANQVSWQCINIMYSQLRLIRTCVSGQILMSPQQENLLQLMHFTSAHPDYVVSGRWYPVPSVDWPELTVDSHGIEFERPM